jgi:hypothetical protein
MAERLTVAAATGVRAYVARRAGEILDREGLWELLPPCREVRASAEAVVAEGTPLAEAHRIWRAAYLAGLPGLGELQRQAADAVAPAGLVRVAVECVDEPSGGMSSFHGFRGTFVSLLVSLPQGCVWDVRVEPAT